MENFVTKTLEPLGFHVTVPHFLGPLSLLLTCTCFPCVQAIARGPYLCQGDMYRPYYLLHDVVVVAEKA